jgi:hypothetical protein
MSLAARPRAEIKLISVTDDEQWRPKKLEFEFKFDRMLHSNGHYGSVLER